MSDDLIRAKGYGIYKKVLVKALNFLITTLMTSVITDYAEWEAKLSIRIVVNGDRLKQRNVRLSVAPSVDTLEINSDVVDLVSADTTIINREDLGLLTSGTFETVMQTIDEK